MQGGGYSGVYAKRWFEIPIPAEKKIIYVMNVVDKSAAMIEAMRHDQQKAKQAKDGLLLSN